MSQLAMQAGPPPIESFSGSYRFMSNFYVHEPVELDMYEVLLRITPDSYGNGLTPLRLRDLRSWKSVEHAYQAAKVHGFPYASEATRFGSPEEQILRIREASSPGEAKKLGAPPDRGGRIVMRPDWDQIKVSVMLALLRSKFAPERDLASLLVRTSPAVLVEGNTWGDTYWGVCNGKGKNMLGRCLMLVRQELNVAMAAGIDVREVRGGR